MSHLRDNPLGSACRRHEAPRAGPGRIAVGGVYRSRCRRAGACHVGVYDTDELPSMIDITYKIKGAEDPYTATIEMEDGKYSADTAVLSTRRSSSKLIAVVTSVETY